MQKEDLIKKLNSGLILLGLDSFSCDIVEKLVDYILLLAKWNKVHSLTSVTDLEEMLIYHVLDSIVAYPYIKSHKTILDIGTGPGIPGIILATVMPDSKFSLLDSNKKKLKFVQHAITCLKLSNVEVVDARIERYSPQQKFSLVVSRAFSDLNNFLELGVNSIAHDGVYMAYKGTNPDLESKPLPKGFSLNKVVDVDVPWLNKNRCLVFVDNKAAKS